MKTREMADYVFLPLNRPTPSALGAGDGTRTRDNLLGRQELYHEVTSAGGAAMPSRNGIIVGALGRVSNLIGPMPAGRVVDFDQRFGVHSSGKRQH